MLAVADVDSVNGMPEDAAALATATSPPRQPKPTAPVGAIAMGRLAVFPRKDISVFTLETPTRTFRSNLALAQAARFSRNLSSSSAPPSMKSNTGRGSPRFAAEGRAPQEER